jgi:hypothetical protein
MTDTPDERVEAFKAQINEAEERGLEPHPIEEADDMLNMPLAWVHALVVDMHLTEFLRLHPHLQGARNIPAIRKAILVDLIDKGIL